MHNVQQKNSRNTCLAFVENTQVFWQFCISLLILTGSYWSHIKIIDLNLEHESLTLYLKLMVAICDFHKLKKKNTYLENGKSDLL